MANLIKGGGLVMLSHYSLLKVLKVKTYMLGTIRLVRKFQQRYPLCRPGNRCSDSLSNHVIKHILDLFLIFYGLLASGVLIGRTLGSVLMVYIPDMLPIVSKELGKLISCHYVLDLGCGARVSHLG